MIDSTILDLELKSFQQQRGNSTMEIQEIVTQYVDLVNAGNMEGAQALLGEDPSADLIQEINAALAAQENTVTAEFEEVTQESVDSTESAESAE